MQTLITPTVVVARAFADGEYVAPETVSEAAIVAAQETYLRPVTGDALFERLLAGDHADFADEYLAAPLALYVRYLIARPAARTGRHRAAPIRRLRGGLRRNAA